MKLLMTAVALAAFPIFAHAQDAEEIVEARQGFYELLGLNMGTLAGMAKGEIEYDEAKAVTAAANIQALTGYDLPALFIEGTSLDDIDNTEARPAIWENTEDFAKKYEGLREAAAGASEAVAGGQENVGPVVQKLGGACKACHDEYRETD